MTDEGKLTKGKKNNKTLAEQPKDPTRRKAIEAGALGAAALAASSVLGAGPVAAQDHSNPQETKEFSGKCAFITGGARGIGLACAEELAKAGANIVIYDVASQIDTVKYPLASESDLVAAKSKFEALGVKCLTIKGDTRDKESLDSAMEQAVRSFGSLDILIVNAGVMQTDTFEKTSEQEVQSIVDINLTGSVKTVQAALPIMEKQKSGRIIFIASAFGRVGNKDVPVYSATKWGIIGFAKSAALMMARYNVTCNVVCPTLVRTKLTNNSRFLNFVSPENPTFEAVAERLNKETPLPVGNYEPVEIARVVKFFCGESTAKITGEVFDVSAGLNARNVA